MLAQAEKELGVKQRKVDALENYIEDLEEKLLLDRYNQEDLKFYQLRTLRLCHIMVQDHQKEGEYNADYIKCYRQKLESFNKTK